jgi:hypothetical protein
VRCHFLGLFPAGDLDKELRQASSAGDVGQHERRVLGNTTKTVITEVDIEQPESLPETKPRNGAKSGARERGKKAKEQGNEPERNKRETL